jgi:hypothetical protein
MKKISALVIIGEVKIKTTIRFDFYQEGERKIINVGKEVEKREPCLSACKFLQLLLEKVWRFLKNLKIVLQYDPHTPLLDTYPKEK